MAAISVLLRRGYRNLIQVKGGLNAWQAAGLAVER
jgi:rhodanese-related sulfurtransferase